MKLVLLIAFDFTLASAISVSLFRLVFENYLNFVVVASFVAHSCPKKWMRMWFSSIVHFSKYSQFRLLVHVSALPFFGRRTLWSIPRAFFVFNKIYFQREKANKKIASLTAIFRKRIYIYTSKGVKVKFSNSHKSYPKWNKFSNLPLITMWIKNLLIESTIMNIRVGPIWTDPFSSLIRAIVW